jgi:MarC family membrane protein
LESDPAHLEREAVRLARDHVDGARAVLLLNAIGEIGRHAERRELHQRFAHLALFAPRIGQAFGAAASQPGDLRQAFWLFVEDAERVEPEVRHDPLGGLGADAGDGARPQVPFEPRERIRRQNGDRGRADLLTVRAIDLDAASDAHPTAHRDRRKHADHRSRLALAVDEDAKDAKRRGGALEGDSLHLSFEDQLGFPTHDGITIVLPSVRSELVTHLVVTFGSVFAIVDPFAALPIFVALTADRSPEERKAIALRAALTCGIVLTVFGAAGTLIMSFFSISLPAFKIAGGILLFGVGLEMLRAKPSGTRSTREEETEAQQKDDVAIIPLGLPLLAGPGAIATVMVLAGKQRRARSAARCSRRCSSFRS